MGDFGYIRLLLFLVMSHEHLHAMYIPLMNTNSIFKCTAIKDVEVHLSLNADWVGLIEHVDTVVDIMPARGLLIGLVILPNQAIRPVQPRYAWGYEDSPGSHVQGGRS